MSDSTSPAELLHGSRFSRSSKHDALAILNSQMGPNPLWLTEWLCDDLPLAPGNRILDLGCGKALSPRRDRGPNGVQANPMPPASSTGWIGPGALKWAVGRDRRYGSPLPWLPDGPGAVVRGSV